MFNIPGCVLALLCILGLVHAVRSALPEDELMRLTLAMALIPARYAGYAAELPGGKIAEFTSLFTHMLVHGDLLTSASTRPGCWPSAAPSRIGSARSVFLCFVLFGLAGAALFLAVNPTLLAPMVGASGAISGLMGASMRFLFSAVDGDGVWRLREAPRTVPLMSLSRCLRDNRIMGATGMWLLINLLAAVLGFGGLGPQGGIAWASACWRLLAGFLGVRMARSCRLHPARKPGGQRKTCPGSASGPLMACGTCQFVAA